MSRINRLARRSLDERLGRIDQSALTPPAAGWLRAIRDALGMTTRQLAGRAGMTAAAISKAERSETAGTIQLSTLRRIADALDCEVVYALVPRRGLEATVQDQARAVATATIAAVSRSMELEAQGVDGDTTRRQRDELAERLAAGSNLWRGT